MPRLPALFTRFFSLLSISRFRVVIVSLMMVLALPVLGHAQSSVRPPEQATTPAPLGPDMQGGVLGNKSDSVIWHEIRKGMPGNVTIPDPNAAILIQSQGEDWRLLHNDYISPFGARILAAILAILTVFFAIRGRMKIKSGRSGRVIPRFSLVERVVHWFTATLFVLLGVSGLILLFGRPFLLPLIGPELFGIIASASMQGHNLFGPLFLLAIVSLFVIFVRGNGYRWVDLKWVFKGGGFFGGHASSGRYNFGEKSWFWWASICGLAISVTGMMMLFPRSCARIARAGDGRKLRRRVH